VLETQRRLFSPAPFAWRQYGPLLKGVDETFLAFAPVAATCFDAKELRCHIASERRLSCVINRPAAASPQ
jgi:hypothetical protein